MPPGSPATSTAPSTSAASRFPASSSTSGKPKVRLVECGPLNSSGGVRAPPGGIAAQHHLNWACTATGQRVRVMTSTAQQLGNRERDKMRVETSLGLSEFGDPVTEFYAAKSGLMPVALGYERIVYGDHGPYVEFSSHQICWSTFPNFFEKPEFSYYDECYTADGLTMLYAQKRHVMGKPNPPQSGDWSHSNNRPEGYANYLVGRFYIAAEVGAIAVRLSGNGARRRRRRAGQKSGVGGGEKGEKGKGGGKGSGQQAEQEGPADFALGDHSGCSDGEASEGGRGEDISAATKLPVADGEDALAEGPAAEPSTVEPSVVSSALEPSAGGSSSTAELPTLEANLEDKEQQEGLQEEAPWPPESGADEAAWQGEEGWQEGEGAAWGRPPWAQEHPSWWAGSSNWWSSPPWASRPTRGRRRADRGSAWAEWGTEWQAPSRGGTRWAPKTAAEEGEEEPAEARPEEVGGPAPALVAEASAGGNASAEEPVSAAIAAEGA